ncbi:MAG: metal-dependent hydrolase [Pyrinomonadaceae bacterium]
MDNLTHTLVGLVAAKAGLERVSPYATAVCVLAANGPDADILAALGGHWFYLEHHRGVTHSLVGTLALSLLIPLLFYAADRVLARLRRRPPRGVRLGGLFVASLLLSASHPLLDWTNNYGVRPWLPWNGRWYYGDLVFIVDPWLWLSLGGAAFLLASRKKWQVVVWALLALALSVAFFILPARSGMPFPFVSQALWLAGVIGLFAAWRFGMGKRFGQKLAAAALALVVAYWGGLWLLQARAESHAREVAAAAVGRAGETLRRIAAMPTLADPLNWVTVAETERAYYRFNTSALSRERTVDGWHRAERFPKPQGVDAERAAAAAEDWRTQIFLAFSRFPATRVTADCAGATLVQFADLRFTAPGRARGGGSGFQVEITLPQGGGE